MSLVDLLAILPFHLPFIGLDLRMVRVLRLFRIFRVAKIGRYYSSLSLIGRTFQRKKEELVLTTAIMLILLLLSASVMYYCEHDVQPDKFPSIPAALWWAAATLTTVGYGDVYPIAALGKTAAVFVAILSIGMFALPTGILGAGFVETIQSRRKPGSKCPHCGGKLPPDTQ